MSLMRLLAAGRSIGTIENQPSRYRMTQQNLLPKFGPVRRAEALQPEPANRQEPDNDVVEKRLSPAQPTRHCEKTRTNTEVSEPVAPRSGKPSAFSKLRIGPDLWRWCIRSQNPFCYRTASR